MGYRQKKRQRVPFNIFNYKKYLREATLKINFLVIIKILHVGKDTYINYLLI